MYILAVGKIVDLFYSDILLWNEEGVLYLQNKLRFSVKYYQLMYFENYVTGACPSDENFNYQRRLKRIFLKAIKVEECHKQMTPTVLLVILDSVLISSRYLIIKISIM